MYNTTQDTSPLNFITIIYLFICTYIRQLRGVSILIIVDWCPILYHCFCYILINNAPIWHGIDYSSIMSQSFTVLFTFCPWGNS